MLDDFYFEPTFCKPRLSGNLKERLYKSFCRNINNHCWEWTRSLDKFGYGVLYLNSKAYKAHRISYEVHFGVFSNELLICHKCDNPKCVNPEHLFLGTQKDNMIDMAKKGRHPLSIKGISRDVPIGFKERWNRGSI